MPVTACGMALDFVSLRLKTFVYLQTICEMFIACLVKVFHLCLCMLCMCSFKECFMHVGRKTLFL
jgi:hypothetical protein